MKRHLRPCCPLLEGQGGNATDMHPFSDVPGETNQSQRKRKQVNLCFLNSYFWTRSVVHLLCLTVGRVLGWSRCLGFEEETALVSSQPTPLPAYGLVPTCSPAIEWIESASSHFWIRSFQRNLQLKLCAIRQVEVESLTFAEHVSCSVCENSMFSSQRVNVGTKIVLL